MNKVNLLRVADAIEKHAIDGLGYNQDLYVSRGEGTPDLTGQNCGTTACLAGWAFALAHGHPPIEYDPVGIRDTAQFFLNLDGRQATDLFSASPFYRENPVTASEAVRTLRYAAEHGVIDWDAANPPEAS